MASHPTLLPPIPNFRCFGRHQSDANGYDHPIGVKSINEGNSENYRDRDSTQTKTTAYYIDEGVNGCFKDRVLCGVNFEPCPVSLAGGRRLHQRMPATAAGDDAVESQRGGGLREEERNTAAVSAAAGARAETSDGEQEEAAQEEVEDEDAVVMGPSGLPEDVVARKRLPKSLKPGDWLYFSQMGAYTASIATVTSSAVLEASYCYVASAPDEGATAAASRG